MKNTAKVISIVCVVGFFATFFFGISFYYRGFPGRPQPALGRTHPINNHGFLLYLTKQEEFEQRLSFVFAGVFFISAAIADCFFDPFDRRKRESLPKKVEPWNNRRGP
jgi:hypothetical protein